MNAHDRRPNVVFFFTDDQRFDTIHALGNAEISTPHIDRLVAMGTAFTRAHIPGGTSGAVCMPSRAMLHSGRTLFHLAKEGQTIPAEHTLLGETLRAAGYRTFGTGKWHNSPAAYARSFSDGGEIFFGGMWDHWNVPACRFDPTGQYEQARPWIRDFAQSNKIWTVTADHLTPGKHSSELFGNAAVEFVEQGENTPFFLYLSFMAPHDPRSMPERFLKMYDPATLTLPANFACEHAFDFGGRQGRDETLAPYPRTPELVRRHLAEYYAMISHLDHQIGRVMQTLEDRGLFENTLFVFAGDNGLALGQHGLFGKQNLYDHSVRVPLIFAGPGVPRGERRDGYAYLLDIYPTLCDLLQLPAPVSVEGVSLAPALADPAVRPREMLYLAYTDRIRGMRDERYKLLEYVYEGHLVTQLFDLQDDPWELNNLAASAAHGTTVGRLRAHMRAHALAWDDRAHRLGANFWTQHDALCPEGRAGSYS